MAVDAANPKGDLSETSGVDFDDSPLSSNGFARKASTLSAKDLFEQRRVRRTSIQPTTPIPKVASAEERFRAKVLEFLAKLDERLDKLTSQVERFPSRLPSESSSYVEVAVRLGHTTGLVNAGTKDLRHVECSATTSEDDTNAQRQPEGTSVTDVSDCADSNGSGMAAVPSCFKTPEFLLSKDCLQEKGVHLEHASCLDEQQAPVSPPMDEDCLLHGNGDQQLVPHAGELELPIRKTSKESAAMAIRKRGRTSILSNEVMSHMSRKTRTRTVVEKQVWSFLDDPDLKSGGRHFARLMCLAILCSTAIPVLQTINPPPFDVFTMGIFGAVL
ncbi:unnamed protein product [Polarella glacialis]|uniref:Uncharacterized protein n=1 Tax=Polarella glacialis TaxID=89957 RepID=A0A813JYX3_POLGL|nr:unnamed protein product [Polarella glacialis]